MDQLLSTRRRGIATAAAMVTGVTLASGTTASAKGKKASKKSKSKPLPIFCSSRPTSVDIVVDGDVAPFKFEVTTKCVDQRLVPNGQYVISSTLTVAPSELKNWRKKLRASISESIPDVTAADKDRITIDFF